MQAGQCAAGLSRPWHIKATGPTASPPVAPQSATSKAFWVHCKFPSKALDAALTHASKAAKEIWLKAHYWEKVGGRRRDWAWTEEGKRRHTRQDHALPFSRSPSNSPWLHHLTFFNMTTAETVITVKMQHCSTSSLFSLPSTPNPPPPVGPLTLKGHVPGHLI